MNIREFVLSLDLPNDGTMRVDCPSCNSKNTLSISNDDGVILYHCYKLRCNAKGAVHQGLTAQYFLSERMVGLLMQRVGR